MTYRACLLRAVLFLGCCATAAVGYADSYREVAAPDSVQRDFKGRVRTVRQTTFVEKDGRPQLKGELLISFDAAGYQLEETTRDAEDGSQTSERRSYDGDGNLIKVETDHGGKDRDALEVETDAKTQTVRYFVSGRPGKRRLVKELVYGPYHKESFQRTFDEKGRLKQVARVTRDTRGLESEVLIQNAKGKTLYRTLPQWDERGFEAGSVLEFKEDNSSAVTTIQVTAVDSAGNWTERRETGKFIEAGGELPSDPEVVVRKIDYHP